MRTVRIGEQDVKLLGSAYSIMAWHFAFGQGEGDILKALVRIESGKFGTLPDALRVAYALAATAWRADGSKAPAFDAWVDSLGALGGLSWVKEVVDEAEAGLFRPRDEQGEAEAGEER